MPPSLFMKEQKRPQKVRNSFFGSLDQSGYKQAGVEGGGKIKMYKHKGKRLLALKLAIAKGN